MLKCADYTRATTYLVALIFFVLCVSPLLSKISRPGGTAWILLQVGGAVCTGLAAEGLSRKLNDHRPKPSRTKPNEWSDSLDNLSKPSSKDTPPS
jgi:hypothetical protein